MMEDIGQNPLDDGHDITEIPTLEATKQHLNYLNFNLEKDLERLDEANQLLFRKIQKKEKSIQSLEREIALSTERVPEMDEFNEIAIQKENALKDLELETAKLVRRFLKETLRWLLCSSFFFFFPKRLRISTASVATEVTAAWEEKNKTLSEKIMQLQDRISTELKNPSPDPETLKKKIAELKVKLQKSTKSCAEQEKEIAKMQSDYQSVHELCEDQAHYIKKYQEILREMEKEQEVRLLEKEMSKAKNDCSQKVKPGATLVETIQSNVENNIIKKEKKKFLVRHFHYLFFMIVVFLRILGCMVFHLQYINPDFLVDTLPMLMSRSTLNWLRDILFPFLTLEVDDLLPH